jgi:hypothetical protein
MESTTQPAKCVETSILEDVSEVHAPAVTFAADVGVQSRSIGVLGVRQIRLRTHTHLNRAAWAAHLSHHPDSSFSGRILRYLDEGVPIFYDGPDVSRVCPNWQSCETFREAVKKTLVEDVALGRKSGPFAFPPLPNFVGSPLGAFCKKRSGKIRVIHDLSWPPYHSVNAYIDPLLCSVSYISVDTAVREVKLRGRYALMSKIDLKDAYKNIVVRPADWHHLGSTWVNDQGQTEYFVDHVLPFGLRSSAKLFDLFASGVEFCMYLNKCSNVCHYLDDFYTCGRANTSECEENLRIMLETCTKLGMPVQSAKTVTPTTRLEFLGIIIDTTVMETQMSQERLDDIFDELRRWKDDFHGTKRELLSLLGKLVFLCRIVTPGRIFIRRLFDLSKSVRCLQHKVRLSREAAADVAWWLAFCSRWNHRSVFYEDDWSSSTTLFLATDASGTGIGGVYGTKWFARLLTPGERSMSITFLELLAVVSACACWGELWAGKKIHLHCDNAAVVFCVNSGNSKNAAVMSLIRQLYFIAASCAFDIRLVHVPGAGNVGPDLLSRARLLDFRVRFPEFEDAPTYIPSF